MCTQLKRLGKSYCTITDILYSGNLTNLWDEKTNQIFLEKAECMKDQYSNYTIKQINLNMNGANTLGENIADNGGVKEAYYAYRKLDNTEGLLFIRIYIPILVK